MAGYLAFLVFRLSPNIVSEFLLIVLHQANALPAEVALALLALFCRLLLA